ncbi:MAG: hypothetical protein R3D67_02400 [Hyphomicrobiaceae bacterium]
MLKRRVGAGTRLTGEATVVEGDWQLWGLAVLGSLLGALLLYRLMHRWGARRMIGLTACLILVGASATLLVHATGRTPSWGRGLTMSSITAWLQNANPAAATNAAASHDNQSPKPQTAASPPKVDPTGIRARLTEAQAELAKVSAERDNLRRDLSRSAIALEKSRRELGGTTGHLKSVEASMSTTKAFSSDAQRLKEELEAERAEHQQTRQALSRAEQARQAAIRAATVTASRLERELASEKAARLKSEAQAKEAMTELEKSKTAAAPATNVATASLLKVLQAEREAHEKARIALQAIEAQTKRLEVERKRLQAELLQTARERDRLRSSSRNASGEGVAKALAVIAELEAQQRQANAHVSPVATGALAVPSATLTQSMGSMAQQLKAELAQGVSEPQLVLSTMPVQELVRGLEGTYYRIVCRDPQRQTRLTFASASFLPTGGDEKVLACFKALQEVVLSQLPPRLPIRVFTQGFASDRRFARPRALATRDQRMRVVRYLPRRNDANDYASVPRTQSTSAYTNDELVNLRGAYIAGLLADASKAKLTPSVLEGEIKPAGDEQSTSFDLILYIGW